MKKSKGSFYITTAIDYVNSLPHIGTAYEKIGADVLARWKRREGFDVHFQMGNDEHSTNVLKSTRARGLEPKKYCDEMRKHFEGIWKKLNISYDDFIQTSENRHIKAVQSVFQKIYEAGDIRKAHYEGWYCESCEAFYTEKDLTEGVCPNHKTKPKWIREENYFFALSKYEQKLLDFIKKNPEFIEPEGRRNEVISMIKQGLQDVSISRAGFEWGIPVPFDKEHVVYVWFDALVNYISAVGFGKNPKLFKKRWPASVHIIGKDIIRFHCVIWPAMLMSVGIPLPKTVFAHGFVYLKGEKMSKTLGNVVTPLDVADSYGSDALRYYLLRSAPFGKDTDFTWENFIDRYNADLANGIGNLVSRTAGMISRYLNGNMPRHGSKGASTNIIGDVESKVRKAMDYTNGELEFHIALTAIMEAVTATDRYINENAPWKLAKDGNLPKVTKVLVNVYNAIEIITDLLSSFVPETAEKIYAIMGFGKKAGKIKMGKALFPRIESSGQAPTIKAKEKKMEEKEEKVDNLINISEFAKIDLRIAEIKGAQRVDGADKLLKLDIDIGGEARQIVAGIAKHYSPEVLIGKKIVVVANLVPAKIRGIESQGMLLATSNGDTLSILTPDKDIPSGSKIK